MSSVALRKAEVALTSRWLLPSSGTRKLPARCRQLPEKPSTISGPSRKMSRCLPQLSVVDSGDGGGQTHRHVTRRKLAERRTRARSDSPGQIDAGLYYQRSREGACFLTRDWEHARVICTASVDDGAAPIVFERPGQRLGNRRVRHASARDRAGARARELSCSGRRRQGARWKFSG